MIRGGAWLDPANTIHSAARSHALLNYYDNQIGFRIARTE